MSDTKKEIEQALKNSPGDIAFEPIPDESTSPLAQPVVEKVSSAEAGASAAEKKENKTSAANKEENKKEEKQDAPEQEINADPAKDTGTSSGNSQEESEFTVPIATATMMADSLLGMVNNTVFEVGAGYFVTISKHKDFYDFDELIHVIDEQNTKNIQRIKLDEEDKALLRPLLVHILRKKAKVLSPEQQLLGVCLSIIIKKAKVVMEIRAENELLVDRLLDIIRKERATYNQEEQQREETAKREEKKEEEKKNKEDDLAEVVYEETTQSTHATSRTGLPDAVLETVG